MSIYKEFTILFPYLQSVRKLKSYLSFDIEFPDTWKLPKKFVNEEKVIENQKSNYTDYTIFFWPKTVFEKKETVNAFIRKYLGIGTLIKQIKKCSFLRNRKH